MKHKPGLPVTEAAAAAGVLGGRASAQSQAVGCCLVWHPSGWLTLDQLPSLHPRSVNENPVTASHELEPALWEADVPWSFLEETVSIK